MNDDSNKVFDVSKPSRVSPSNTSRPLIVGHRPTMADPMMRPGKPAYRPEEHQASVPSTSTKHPAPSSLISAVSHGLAAPPAVDEHHAPIDEHHSKVISVSESIRSEIAASESHLPATPEATNLPASTEIAVPQPAIVSTSSPTLDEPASNFINTATTPGGNSVSPEPGVKAPTPTPQAITPEVHHQSLPMGHSPVTSAGRLKHLILWLFVGVFLVGFAGYIAVDAGFINTSLKLPFHIFNRQS